MNNFLLTPTFFIMLLIPMMMAPVTLSSEETHNTLTEQEAKDIIDRVYLQALQRYPDEKGLYTYTKHLMREGKNEDWLMQVLLNSEEGRVVTDRKKKKMIILYGVASFPLLFIGLAFYFRKNTKDFFLNSLLVIFSVCIACFFVEITLRITSAYKDHKNDQSWNDLDSTPIPKNNAAVFLRDIIQLSANPTLIYELMPNLSVRFMKGRVKTDTDGLRITPGSCEQPGSYNIIGLGDSVMFGWGVHDEETYLAYLAQVMSDDCTRIVNLAVPGYNTVMEVEALKDKGLNFHPDLVLMHFVDNDLFLPNFIRKKDKHITLTRSYLLAALSRWQGTKIRTRPFDHLVRNPGEVPDNYQYMIGVDAYRQAMIQLKKLSRDNNFRILLLANWTAPDFVKDIASELTIPLIELGTPLQQYCRENGVTYSDMTISKNDPHYSPLAHRIIASEVYKHIIQNTSHQQK